MKVILLLGMMKIHRDDIVSEAGSLWKREQFLVCTSHSAESREEAQCTDGSEVQDNNRFLRLASQFFTNSRSAAEWWEYLQLFLYSKAMGRYLKICSLSWFIGMMGAGTKKCLEIAEYSNNYLMTKHSLSLVLSRKFAPKCGLIHVEEWISLSD